jgi:GrpB-like predicted nucleotidyltransferase (UPF0157 family)
MYHIQNVLMFYFTLFCDPLVLKPVAEVTCLCHFWKNKKSLKAIKSIRIEFDSTKGKEKWQKFFGFVNILTINPCVRSSYNTLKIFSNFVFKFTIL